jgi:hypothetical protein
MSNLIKLPRHIEHWPLDKLIPYARNPRRHSDAQVAQIAESIQAFGFNAPILVDSQAGIIAGHGRLLAARKLKMPAVPVIILDHLTEAQKRAYIIADNQIALKAGWDDEKLRAEMADLKKDIDLSLLGFDREELDRMLDRAASAVSIDDDATPDPAPNPVTRPGDLWLMGQHRLLCGDALLAESYEKLLGDRKCTMSFTDPPYGVAYVSKSARRLKIKNDNLGANFGPFLRQACHHLLHFTQGAVYICMSSSQLHTLREAFDEAGGHWSTFVIWAKNVFTLGRSDYQRQYEPILYGWKEGTLHYWCGARNQGDVWFIDKPYRNDIHPTMKPVELVERAVCNSSA